MQTCNEILEDSERPIQQYHNTNTVTMTKIALAPCSPFSVSETVMRESAKLAEKNYVLLHTNLTETEDENSFCLETIGYRPLEYLEQVGWLHNGTWLAHGIHFTDEEIKKTSCHKNRNFSLPIFKHGSFFRSLPDYGFGESRSPRWIGRRRFCFK